MQRNHLIEAAARDLWARRHTMNYHQIHERAEQAWPSILGETNAYFSAGEVTRIMARWNELDREKACG